MGAKPSSAVVRATTGRVSQQATNIPNIPHFPKNDSNTSQNSFSQPELEPSQFLQNLKQIGQVKVDSQACLRESQQMTHVIRTRAASEIAPITNTSIDAISLSELFDARKRGELSYGKSGTSIFDPKLLERLASRYNSPSVGRENTLTLPDGEQRTYKEAIWIESSR